MQYRKFGKTGKNVSVLGFGCMRFPMSGSQVDEKETIRILHEAIDGGVNYLDTAYIYHDGHSEVITGKALKQGYRQKTYLATKSPTWLIEKESDFDRYLDEQLKRLDTDYIDFYLLHSLGASTWDKVVQGFDLPGKAEKALKAGKIRHLGFSFHDELPFFKHIVDAYDKWEFCQIQLNYLGETHQAGLEGMYYAASKGLAVIAMSPLMGGRLSNPHQAATDLFHAADPHKSVCEWALDYVWDKLEISILLSGMSSMEQLRQNMAYADRARPHMLTDKDHDLIKAVQAQFNMVKSIPCTNCKYCMPCPADVDIPGNFAIYNELYAFDTPALSKDAYDFMHHQSGGKSTAENCVKCGKCEPPCPQHIAIIKELENVAAAFSH